MFNIFKKITALLLIISFMPISNVFAFSIYESSGEAITRAPYYSASDDFYFVDFDPDVVSKIIYGTYTDESFTTKLTEKVDLEKEGGYVGTHRFTCNSYYKAEYYNDSDQIVGVVKFQATELVNPSCDSSADNGTGDETCDSCAVFECPGWSEFMEGMESIKDAIPPTPNWGNVADIFRDSIAPQIKADMTALLGSAPNAPSAPSAPSAPDTPGALDDGGLQTPTGQEAPGLADSGFTEDDIKNEAEEIEIREDPTGGFDLPDDPTIGLPSQEEFLENAPVEGSAPLPGAPLEQENIAPDPGDTTDIAPAPPEVVAEVPTAPVEGAAFPEAPQDGATVPTAPEEPENFSPTPSDDTSTAPVPSDDTGTAPTPGESFDGYPIPGADTSTAPIPGSSTDTAPIP